MSQLCNVLAGMNSELARFHLNAYMADQRLKSGQVCTCTQLLL